MKALLPVTCYLRLYVTTKSMNQGNINDPFSIVQETDKAVIDVEAQDDGIMGKILV